MVNRRQGQSESTSVGENITEKDVDKLIDKVCSKFICQLESKLDAKLDKLDSKLNQVYDSITNLNKTVSQHSTDISELQAKVDFLEQDRKRNRVRFCGIPETADENLFVTISSFISAQLKIPCEVHDFDYVFRVGRDRRSNSDKPGTIIANFIVSNKRAEVLNNKKLLKGTSYALFEDLTAKRYDLLAFTKKKYGNNKVWSSGGNIFYWDSRMNKKIKVETKNDL